ncbi:hypothetical protein FLAN108750_08840 [Flavobacterium antarcticum]
MEWRFNFEMVLTIKSTKNIPQIIKVSQLYMGLTKNFVFIAK